MEFLLNYEIKENQIAELKERYNENIINFMIQNKEFIIEKLEYLKKENYIIYPIIANNIRVFLEIMPSLMEKIEIMKKKGLSKKQIQIVLMNEKLYSKIENSKKEN